MPENSAESDGEQPETHQLDQSEAKRYGRLGLQCMLWDRAIDVAYIGLFAFLAARPLDRYLQDSVGCRLPAGGSRVTGDVGLRPRVAPRHRRGAVAPILPRPASGPGHDSNPGPIRSAGSVENPRPLCSVSH